MMLIEQTQVQDAALPVTEFRDHLQLGSGFADDGLQDGVLLPQLKAALKAVESETGKVLLTRSYQYVVTAWRDMSGIALPVAPVTAIQSLTITDLNGGDTLISADTYGLVQDTHRPSLVTRSWSLPTIPVGGTAEIVFDAGYGAAWSDAPADLRQAILMLATHFYENRGAVNGRVQALPQGPMAICARYKPVRIFGGGRR